MTEVTRYAVDDHVAVITIDRPEARNAIDPEVALGIEAGIESAEQNDDVRVVILTGTPPVFCAGADLKTIGAGREAELRTPTGGYFGVTRKHRTKPLIAAVEGAALAGGTEIVLACDLVVAAENAFFGIPEVKRGLIAGAGGLFRLSRRLPLNIALECALTGESLDAATAHRHGLVNRLCEPGAALSTARELAALIAANAPLAVRESRAVILDTAATSEEEAWDRSASGLARMLESDDLREGIAAFVEKRPPVWTGR